MKAVVLAAGQGKRMHPLTHTRPKVMVPLAGKPLLEHVLGEIVGVGITEVIFVVGYLERTIRDHFGSGERWGAHIEYVTQQEQRGTGDAVATVRHMIDAPFLVMNGDIIVRGKDLRGVGAQLGNAMTIIGLEDTTDMGVVEVDGGQVRRIHEKVQNPPSQWVNAGVYRFTPDIFQAIETISLSPRGEYELTDAIQLLIERNISVSAQTIDTWINVSYPWDLLSANEILLDGMESRIDGEIEEHAVLKGPVFVGRGTIVRAGTYIEGPVVIGEDCRIGPHCYIRPSTAIGHRCHIGAAVEIKNSIIMNDSNAPHLNYVGDSVIGENCNLGAGTKIANLKLDKHNIRVGDVDTGRHKLGAIIGDNVQIGINASLNVGCSIGNDSQIGPGMVVSGTMRPKAWRF